MINENLTKDSTDMERAETVYRKLLEDFEIRDYESMVSPEVEYKDGISYYALPTVVELVAEGHSIPEYMVPYLYHDILLQLGVENEVVFGTGKFKETGIKSMESTYSYQTYQSWIVVSSDKESYHCDLSLDMYVKRDFMKDGSEGTYRPRFFGMSDEKRNDSFEAEMVQSETGMAIPECPKNFYDDKVTE